MKILILKLGAIGDVVMASSLITAIDEKYPEAEITWICGRIVEPILSGFGRINKIFAIDEHKLYHGSLLEKISIVIQIWKFLFGQHFDIVLNCYRDRRYKLLLLPAAEGVYKDAGYKNKENFLLPGRYHADEYSRMISDINDWQLTSSKFPEIYFPEISHLKELIGSTTLPKIILAPGGTKNILRHDDLRRWAIENYANLVRELNSKNFSVILVGAETDSWVLPQFDGTSFINLIGKTSLLELIAVFNNADLLVTHDNGILHLAKLSKVKVAALFGPVNPKERVGINENIEILWGGANLPCSPCYNGKTFAPCGNNICMKNISVMDVLTKIENVFNPT